MADTPLRLRRALATDGMMSDRSRVSAGQGDRTVELAERGVDASAGAAQVMREIVDPAEDSTRLMGGLGERFTQIGIIIDLITDIADQTNLPALNAAMEAARAGEHRGGHRDHQRAEGGYRRSRPVRSQAGRAGRQGQRFD